MKSKTLEKIILGILLNLGLTTHASAMAGLPPKITENYDVEQSTKTEKNIQIPEEEYKEIDYAGNVPNPFKDKTTFIYNTTSGNARITIFNLNGELIKTLDGPGPGEALQIKWDGRDNYGVRVPKGIYLILFESGDYKEKGKIAKW